MSQAIIGKLMAVLGIDTAAFEKGLDLSQRQLKKTTREFERAGKKLQSIGKSMSTYITLPIIGAGAGVLKMAGDFEAAMNRVGIATQANAGQMEAMKELALDIGKSTTKSASESADAMDMLAKAGMGTADILNGGARAAVALAEAAGSELDPAASAITDTMAQFKKTTADLPGIINQITGAVNQSKFDFADFTMGMAQAGGVAASAGVEFEDFAAALAATSSQFNSGSDAGTSFKTFILRMVPDTKKARVAMEEFGVSFYDAEGRMKSMADIAQMLQDKFGDMSEMDRTALFKTMFGTDAIRTAIGLMKAGADGIEEMQARIAATDASAQAAQRMKGLNAELEKLSGALETLAINIADSGLLSAVSGVVTKIAEWVDWMSEAHPTTLKWGVAIAALAAAVGPLVFVFGGFFKAIAVLLPLMVKLGPVLSTLSALFLTLGRALIGLAIAGGPLTLLVLAVGAVYLAWKNWDKIKPIVVALYNTVKTYVLDKLNAVWDGVKAGIERVKGFFRSLWDAVVGHSYIPDMVDGIRDHMARLQSIMVDPAKAATTATAQAFQQLQSVVSGILNRLFPQEARHNQFLDDLKALKDYAAQAKLPVEQLAEAVRRLKGEYATEAFGESKVSLSSSPLTLKGINGLSSGLERLAHVGEDAFGGMSKHAKELAGNINDIAIGGLKGLMRGFGSLKEIALDVLFAIGDAIIENLAGGMGMGRGATGGLGGIIAGALGSLFGGGRALGGPVQAGKSYRVNENTAHSEWFTSSQNGYISRPGNDNGPSTIHVTVNARDAVLTETVRGWVRQGVEEATYRGAAMSHDQRARRQGAR